MADESSAYPIQGQWATALAKLKRGDVTPSLLAALSVAFEEWARDPERLKGLSVRDTISLVNTLLGAQKVQAQVQGKVISDDAFSARLELVKTDA